MSIVLNGTTGITTPDLDSYDLTVTKAGTPIIADRTGSDGTILDLKKDGSTVGSIGTEGGSGFDAMYIANGDAGLIFQGYANDAIIPFDASNLDKRDAAIDLGYSAGRFKDLYLSGGVYLGGTGAANKLDDYEEGSWTPSITYQSGGPNSSNQTSGSYTKIGGLVNVNGMILCGNTNGGSGVAYLSGLPFTVDNVVANTSVEASGLVSYFANLGTNVNTITLGAINATTKCEIYTGTLTSSAVAATVSTVNSGAQMRFSITYRTSQ